MSVHKKIDAAFGFSVAAVALAAMVGSGMQNGVFAPLGVVLIIGAFVGLILLLVRSVVRASAAGEIKAKERAPDRALFSSSKIVVRTRLRCPYCHDGLTGTISECSGCKATLHDECLLEARGCVTLGCHNRAPKRTVRA